MQQVLLDHKDLQVQPVSLGFQGAVATLVTQDLLEEQGFLEGRVFQGPQVRLAAWHSTEAQAQLERQVLVVVMDSQVYRALLDRLDNRVLKGTLEPVDLQDRLDQLVLLDLQVRQGQLVLLVSKATKETLEQVDQPEI